MLMAIAALLVVSARSAQREPLHVLALSWQPAFCEAHAQVPECAAESAQSFDAGHLSLHGLWPQPGRNVYCNVDPSHRAADEAGHWRELPVPQLGAETRAGLRKAMPGAQSLLDRHEWIKHGTCFGRDAEAYFRESVRLTAAINESAVGELLAARVGTRVTGGEIRATFDEAFGAGAGARVRLACQRDDSRQLLSGITIGLAGDIAGGTPVARLIFAAPPTGPGCPGGIIDPAGLQ
jgi:ribonuclease T2